ncbi:MAG: BON domain-containing protein [Elusimicrobiota bacterium]
MRRLLAAAVLCMTLSPFTACTQHLSELDMSDPGIRARIQAELKAHPELSLRFLQIDVHMRVAYLAGIVESDEMKQGIGQVVRGVAGVRVVINNLLVQD